MHLFDGVLSPPVLVVGSAAALAGVAVGLRRMDYEQVPKVAVLSAAFFVASLVRVPLGPTSTHLALNGLCGLVLGWAAFPAILVGLSLQTILFGFGGLSVLGVNPLNFALPAVVAWYVFAKGVGSANPRIVFVLGCGAGALPVLLTALILGMELYLTGQEFLPVVQLTFLAHLPVMAVEALVTASIVLFVRKVRPEVLALPAPLPVEER